MQSELKTTLDNDTELHIATGASRKTRYWSNEEMSLRAFYGRLVEPARDIICDSEYY